MKIEFESTKKVNKKTKNDRDELDKQAVEYPPIDPYESTRDELDDDSRAAMDASL